MVIFDFDQTLVDTSPVEHLRSGGRWADVMKRVSQLQVYDGIHGLLSALHDHAIPTAIVTKSPSMVSKAIVKQHAWPMDIIVGYHDVRRRKPDPEGLLLAMERAGADPQTVFHVGDQAEDTLAARAAGVTPLGSAWGIPNSDNLSASAPDELFHTVSELRMYLSKRFCLN